MLRSGSVGQNYKDAFLSDFGHRFRLLIFKLYIWTLANIFDYSDNFLVVFEHSNRRIWNQIFLALASNFDSSIIHHPWLLFRKSATVYLSFSLLWQESHQFWLAESWLRLRFAYKFDSQRMVYVINWNREKKQKYISYFSFRFPSDTKF